MRTVLRALSACSIAVLLAACVGRPPTRLAAVPLVPPPSFDGPYRSDVVLEAIGPGIDTSWCGTPGRVMLWVTSNRFGALTSRLAAPLNQVRSVSSQASSIRAAQRSMSASRFVRVAHNSS